MRPLMNPAFVGSFAGGSTPTFILPLDNTQTMGIDYLASTPITLGTSMTKVAEYKGGDANGSGWNAWGAGNNLSLIAGTAPTYNIIAPGLNAADQAVQFNGGGYYKETTGVAIANDYIIECIFRWRPPVSGDDVVFSFGELAGAFVALKVDGADTFFYLDDGTGLLTSCKIRSTNFQRDCYYYFYGYCNRDWNDVNGLGMIFNGGSTAALVAGTSPSTRPNAISASNVCIGAYDDDTELSDDTAVAYLALYTGTGLPESAVAYRAEALSRFYGYQGVMPSVATGTAAPTAATRASGGAVDKIIDAVAVPPVRQFCAVGPDWMRIVDRLDSSGTRVKGYLAEYANKNYLRYSENLNYWPKANCTTVNRQLLGPDGKVSMDAITCNAGAKVSCRAYQQPLLTAETYVYSGFWKPGNKVWVHMLARGQGAYVNMQTGAIGTMVGGVTADDVFIEDWGNGIKRVGIKFAAIAGNNLIDVYVCDADGAYNCTGAGGVDMYFFGMMVSPGDYMYSYIPVFNVIAGQTRAADIFTYKGDDGNLGGVGSNKQGTWVADVLCADYNKDTITYYGAISDGGSADENIRMGVNADNHSLMEICEGAATSDTMIGSSDVFDGSKHTVRNTWADGAQSLYVDEAIEDTGEVTAADMPDDLDVISIGSSEAGTLQLNGVITNLRIYGEPVDP